MPDSRIARAADRIRNIPDFPKPGVQFKDITPLLADPEGFAEVIEVLAETSPRVDAVCGVESRGFIFGAPLAVHLGVGFVPIRKPGKLPGKVIEESFDLEYGSSTLSMHVDALDAGQRVLLVDDLLATGGTLGASHQLIARLGASVAQTQVVIELRGLGGRERIEALGQGDVFSLLTV